MTNFFGTLHFGLILGDIQNLVISINLFYAEITPLSFCILLLLSLIEQYLFYRLFYLI